MSCGHVVACIPEKNIHPTHGTGNDGWGCGDLAVCCHLAPWLPAGGSFKDVPEMIIISPCKNIEGIGAIGCHSRYPQNFSFHPEGFCFCIASHIVRKRKLLVVQEGIASDKEKIEVAGVVGRHRGHTDDIHEIGVGIPLQYF